MRRNCYDEGEHSVTGTDREIIFSYSAWPTRLRGRPSFSKRLKLLRQKTGMTQRQAAEKIGVTAASLSAYENGVQKPSIEVVINTALAFNVSFGWLCGFYDDDDSDIPILQVRTALNVFLSMVS